MVWYTYNFTAATCNSSFRFFMNSGSRMPSVFVVFMLVYQILASCFHVQHPKSKSLSVGMGMRFAIVFLRLSSFFARTPPFAAFILSSSMSINRTISSAVKCFFSIAAYFCLRSFVGIMLVSSFSVIFFCFSFVICPHGSISVDYPLSISTFLIIHLACYVPFACRCAVFEYCLDYKVIWN